LKAIIHIGQSKAGSTAIQFFISKNRRLLKQAGYFVPLYRPTRQYGFHAYTLTSFRNMSQRRLSNHMGINSQAELEEFQEMFAERVQNDLAAASRKQTHVVISAEGLSGRSIEEAQRLRDLLAPTCTEFQIVIYLRRQDLKQVSQFRLQVKNKGLKSNDMFHNKNSPRFDYFATCERWAQVFGDAAVFPRVFPDSTHEPYDLIDDFAQLCGIADTAVYSKLKRPGRRNEAWDWRVVEFNRLMNEYIPALADGKVPKERKRLEGILRECFPECEQRKPARAQARQFFEIYRESNERLRAKWFPEQESLFKEDFSKYPEEPDSRELSVEEAVYIASRILKSVSGDDTDDGDLQESDA